MGLQLPKHPAQPLAGASALVTGGASGIGQAVALALAAAGARVHVADLADGGGRATAAVTGGLALPTDVTDPRAVEAAVDAVVAADGAIDVLVNNAGTCDNTASLEVLDEEWRRVFALNVDAVFWGCRAAGRHMVARGSGAIVNTASMSARIVNRPLPQASYNASKAAVVQLTRSLAAEWAPHGVRVNSVSPGYTATPMTRAALADEGLRRTWESHTPMGRVARPEEVAAAVVHLAGPASSFTTGTDLLVDGGYTAW
jgi:NAD(P)-dependent dehydrogenase (short-subunit alcohol dehydrogenase family)